MLKCYNFIQKYKNLLKENKRLKDELKACGATGICETCTEKSNALVDTYEQVLLEIKEVAKRIQKDQLYYEIYRDARRIVRKVLATVPAKRIYNER